MTDDVVIQKLASIDRCLESVRRYVAGDLERLGDPMVLDAACREVSRHGLGVPADSGDAFSLLERDSLLSPLIADRMRRMVGFRNVALHEYRRLDPMIVRTVVEHRLDDFQDFGRELLRR